MVGNHRPPQLRLLRRSLQLLVKLLATLSGTLKNATDQLGPGEPISLDTHKRTRIHGETQMMGCPSHFTEDRPTPKERDPSLLVIRPLTHRILASKRSTAQPCGRPGRGSGGAARGAATRRGAAPSRHPPPPPNPGGET